MADSLAGISKHLLDLGYAVQTEKEILKVSHPDRYKFWVIDVGPGTLFRTLFKLGRPADSDSAEFLRFMNRANDDAIITRFSTREGFLAVEAWFPDVYEHGVFDVFFRRYVFEISDWSQREAETLNRFFPTESKAPG